MENWRTVIPNGETLEKKHCICDLHFEEEDIIKHYNTCIKTESEDFNMMCTKFRLREGSVPTIFPIKEKKLYSHNEIISNECFEDETNFNEIRENCDMIPKPSKYWFVNATENFVLWNCWTSDGLHSLHKMILYPDMSVKVNFAYFVNLKFCNY